VKTGSGIEFMDGWRLKLKIINNLRGGAYEKPGIKPIFKRGSPKI
jgi:hypothetical protein